MQAAHSAAVAALQERWARSQAELAEVRRSAAIAEAEAQQNLDSMVSAAGVELQGVQSSCGEVKAKAKAKQGQLEQALTSLIAEGAAKKQEHAVTTKAQDARIKELEAEVRKHEAYKARLSAAGGPTSVRARQIVFCEKLKGRVAGVGSSENQQDQSNA